MNKVAVIGGGAAGCMAAIAAARTGSEVTVYESGERIGKKILVTGNGRCNLTNIYADVKNYHGADTEFVRAAAEEFWVDETLALFNEMGVLTKTEDEGKVYPYSKQAGAVVDALRFELERLGVRVVTGFEVCDIIKKNKGFMLVSYDGRRERVETAVVTTGGRAAPSTGSKGGGYGLLEKFGHTVTELSPSLVQIKTKENVKSLKGIKTDAKLSLGSASKSGELLFTEYGLSGPPVFWLSAYLDTQKTIAADIMPEYSESEIEKMLIMRKEHAPQLPIESFFVGMLNKRIGQLIMKQLSILPLSKSAGELKDREISALAKKIKHWEFTVDGTMSWNNAQVTRGGIRTCEFDPKTMGSRLIDGIFAAGEILDIDGDCGGFNLQWAWTSGYIAGKNAAEFEWKKR
ncbi:MAG: NAD(P)/FAD-dependent oxidoreductase [Clostridiales bacterium]|nr:NAD(P)/FAD-dependent oxidoreductase [Clostridiales bacterium]